MPKQPLDKLQYYQQKQPFNQPEASPKQTFNPNQTQDNPKQAPGQPERNTRDQA